METTLLAISDFFAGLPNKVLRYKWTVLGAILGSTAFMLYGALNHTSLDMTLDSFIDQDDPAVAALDEFRSQFGSDDSVFLVYRARDGDVFSEQSLTAIQNLTNDLENWEQLRPSELPATVDGFPVDLNQLEHIRRVRSLANIRTQSVDGDVLRSGRLIPGELPEAPGGLELLRGNALGEDNYLLIFYSADSRYAAVMVQTSFGAQTADDFVPAIDSAGVSLDSSFGAFDGSDSFSVGFDEEAQVEDVPFQTTDTTTYAAFFHALKAVYSNYDEVFEFHPVGNPPMMEFVFRTMQSLIPLAGAMIGIFVILLWLLFRSFSAVVWPIVTIALSVIWTWGATAWLGVTLSTMISLTCLLIFAVGIADCVHVMAAYFSYRKQNVEHDEALSRAYGKTGLALLVTTLTTMAGVLALTSSDLIPIRVFGMMSALGVFMALFFTAVLLPLLLDSWHPGGPSRQAGLTDRLKDSWGRLPPAGKTTTLAAYTALVLVLLGPALGAYIAVISLLTYVVLSWQKQILQTVPGIVARRPMTVLFAFGAVFLSCLYGMSRVNIDSNVAELTREGSDLRVAYEVVDNNMAGAQNLEIMIDAGIADGLMDPVMLQAVDTLQRRIENRYPEQVSRTNSLADLVKDTNQIMNNDDPAYHRIPDSATMISQLLYLFNSANPEDRRNLVSDDYSRSHITINAYNAGSYQYQRFFDELNEELEAAFGPLEERFPELQINVTGTIPLMMRASDELAQSQYSGFLTALVVISFILMLSLGSVQGGLLAIIPNIIPALLAFGLMGLLSIPLDTDTLMIAPVIIGIAVDDTIHFMTNYRLELIRTRNMGEALHNTVRDVGQAVMFTTMVLGLGFAILSFSEYLGMAKMGFFGSLAIFTALLCDLFLIPALLIVFKPGFGVKDVDSSFSMDRLTQVRSQSDAASNAQPDAIPEAQHEAQGDPV